MHTEISVLRPKRYPPASSKKEFHELVNCYRARISVRTGDALFDKKNFVASGFFSVILPAMIKKGGRATPRSIELPY
jgi:hypothetical protein